jgi:transposase InsO family protein
MREVFSLLFHLLSTVAKLVQPGGSRTVIAENLLKSHWVMVVMGQYTRRIIGMSVHAGNVDGTALCRMFNDATSGQGWPERLSSDNDPLFQYHRWKANLRVLWHG